MSNVQVRDIEPEIHDALRERAAAHGSTISDYVLDLIRKDLRTPLRSAWLDRVRSLPAIDTTTAEVLEIRDSGRR